jgi:glycosyltransferase involved in cell wall biosynthesis
MKVLYDAQIFRQQRYGGISRYFCELAPRIAKAEGAEALILAPRHQNAYLREVDPALVVGWYSRHRRRPSWPLALTIKAVQGYAVARFRPDIVHETYFFGPLVQAPRALRVLTIYDMIHERFPALFDAGNPDSRAKLAAAHRADHVICISESTRRDLMELMASPASKITVTHLGASLRPPARPGPAAAGERPYLLYVGERGGYKNFSGLIEALEGSPMLRELQVVCCGGGPIKDSEWAAIDRCGLMRERFTHRVADDAVLASLYAGAACFVYPSLYEGFGIPPLEAMQCGCPVACSNTGSLPEVVGNAAATFNPHDAGAIRGALESVVGSPARTAELRALGHQRAQGFSWDRCASETLAAYHALLANAPAKGH